MSMNYIRVYGKWCKGMQGGGMGTLFLGVSIAVLVLLIVVNALDYGLYSMKRSVISKGLDYAVSAAVQEVDYERSRTGLSEEYDELKGTPELNNVFFNEEASINAFYNTLSANTGLEKSTLKKNTLLVMVAPTDEGLYCIYRKDSIREEETIALPDNLQAAINERIGRFWNDSVPLSDNHLIHVNNNTRTNAFKKRPYYIVFIKDFQINGLIKRRTATFVNLAGAKIERKDD